MPLDRRGGAPLSGPPVHTARHRLAETLDLTVAGLIVVAYAVAATGGFHWETESLRLSISTPSRAIVVAVVLLLVRRWRFPGAPAHPWIRRPGRWIADRIEHGAAARALEPAAGSWGEWIGITAVFIGLVAVMTFRQVTTLDGVPDLGDPLFSIWRLGWVAHQLPRAPLQLFDGNMFFPELRTLAYSDAMLATSLIAAPFLWLGFPLAVVYNVILLLSFAASGVAMYALVRALTGDRWAAVVAGAAFAFYPFRYEHYSHLELQITFWMPLALLMLHRTIESRRTRDGLVTGLLVAMQTLSSLYYGLFLLVVMAVVWAVTVLGERAASSATGGQRTDWRSTLRPWAAAVLVAGILVLPVVIPYFQNRAQLGERPDWEARLYSASPGRYLVVHGRNWLYGRLLDGPRLPELDLFPGLSIVALAVAGGWPKLTVRRAAYVAAALVVLDGSMGANGIVFPTLRDYVLPFRGLRVPARFSILFGLSLSVLAGYGVARLRQAAWMRGALASIVPAVLVVVLLVENVSTVPVMRLPAAPPPIYDYFKGAPSAVVVDLPFPRSLVEATRDARFLYFSTFHWQRILTGTSGYFPESFRETVRMLRGFPSEHGLAFLDRRGVDFIVIARSMCREEEDEYARTTAFLDADPRVELVKRITAPGQDGSIYRISRSQ